MKKEEISRREKSAAVGLVVCFVAMIAIVGMITFSQYQRRTEADGPQSAESNTEEKNNEVADNSMLNNDMDAPYDFMSEDLSDMSAQAANAGEVQAEIGNPIEESPSNVSLAPTQVSALQFAVTDTLSWPVDGNVILSYSMDQTVYFSTLDQYKYNPAMIIAGVVGDEVVSAATGEVISIQKDTQTGTTLRMSLGNGYEVVYGQLKDVCVQEGDRVAKGSLIGYVSEPTKYYSVEGPNLYFQLLKDGEPTDPMGYMEG